MLRYTVLRLLVFAGALAVLWLAGLRDREEMLLLVVGAALVSAVVSFVVLRRFREDYSAQLAARLERRADARAGQTPGTRADEESEDAEVARPTGSPDQGDYR
jgi:type II secretory pathway component PulM